MTLVQNIPPTIESADSYFSKKEFITAQDIIRFKISPKHYENYAKDDEQQWANRNNLVIQDAISCFLHNKDLFHERYAGAAMPKYTKKTQATLLVDDTQQLFETKTVIDKRVFEEIITALQVIYENENIRSIFNSGNLGMTNYRVDIKTGLKIKARAPFVSDTSKLLFDVRIYSKGYYRFISDYFYSGLYLKLIWDLVAFEKGHCALLSASSDGLTDALEIYDEEIHEAGAKELHMLLDIFYWCRKNNYYFDTTEFAQVKKLYKDERLDQNTDKIATCFVIDKFMDPETKLNKGYSILSFPKWIPK